MKEAKSLSTLEKAIAVFKPVMMDFQQKHSTYKFHISVDVVFHEAVDPAVVTQPPVTLTSEMDAHPRDDMNRQLLNSIEVYEQNGSGWVFLNFVSLQLSLEAIDRLCFVCRFIIMKNGHHILLVLKEVTVVGYRGVRYSDVSAIQRFSY